ncbi:protein kinase activating protein dpb11 [Malassezia sp. CBS 17886]|nr:protein kinase activating protein dpb11 [Malassezia sp. CBS 17886]
MSTNRLQRTHRSTKIPNVRLRPPPVRQHTSDRERAALEDDAHFRELRDHGVAAGAHSDADFATRLPLHGVVVSFTGLGDEKRELIDIAKQLGAVVQLNLTSDVTHLLARAPGSEKYHCAIQFHMHVVRPEWLYLVREAWLSGDDCVDHESLATPCRLPALEGVNVALSGVDIDERSRLTHLVESHGGHVAPRLVLDGSLTHLAGVCADAPGKSLTRVLEHQALAREYQTHEALPHTVRAAASIHAVHAAWIDDACAAGVLLRETEYDVRRPLRARAERAAHVATIRARHALPRTTSAPPLAAPPPTHTATAPPTHAAAGRPLTHHVERIHSEAARADSSALCAPRGVLALSRSERFSTAPPAPRAVRAPASRVGGPLLQGRTFRIEMGEGPRTERVARAVQGAGGDVLDDDDERAADYAITPLRAPPRRPVAQRAATHHWLERCLHYETLCDPADHVACTPLPPLMPSAAGVCVSFTGVDRDAPEYHHAVALLSALGASTSDALSRARTTHLLCGNDSARTSVKAATATGWGMHVVGWEFLARLSGGWSEAHSPPYIPAPSSSLFFDDDTIDAGDADEQHAPPSVVYDDPAARKEHTRLMRLVGGLPKRWRGEAGGGLG